MVVGSYVGENRNIEHTFLNHRTSLQYLRPPFGGVVFLHTKLNGLYYNSFPGNKKNKMGGKRTNGLKEIKNLYL